MSSDDEGGFPRGRGRGNVSRRVMRGFDRVALKRARERADMSIATVARLARVGARTVQNWEAGIHSPQVDMLRRVCEVLNVSISDVVVIDRDATYPADLRVLAGLTQPELGRAAQLSTAAIGTIERAEVELSNAALGAIARALNIDNETYRRAFARARERPAGAPA